MNHFVTLFLIVILASFVLSTSVSCSGGSVSFTGLYTPGEDWQAGKISNCSKTYSFTSSGESATGNSSHPYLATYTASPGINNDTGANAVYFKISLPDKYKSCELTWVDFRARANDATGLLVNNSYSSSTNYMNSFITNWEDKQNKRNCVSKTIRPVGKFGLDSTADYASGHDGDYCLSGNIMEYYLSYENFSIAVHNAGDDGTGFFENPTFRFYYKKSNESCNNIDDDCDGVVDIVSGSALTTHSGCSDVGVCVSAVKTCSGGSFGTCSIVPGQLAEECDGLDNDCDGFVDETFDCVKNSSGCTSDCHFDSRSTISCSGAIPLNAEPNFGSTGGKFLQTWTGTDWDPLTQSYVYNLTAGECAFKCESGLIYYSTDNTCILPGDTVKSVSCSGSKPVSGVWNDGGQNGVFTQVNGSPSGVTVAYSSVVGDCKWKCADGFRESGGICISSSQLSECSLSVFGGSLPENNAWNDGGLNGKFVQNWLNGGWSPSSKSAGFSKTTLECAFDCIIDSRGCDLDGSVFCGSGIQNCESGYWGLCETGSAVACSANQFCGAGGCEFCVDNAKNCDLNLSNGCETSIGSDVLNCGSCGNICGTGQSCVLGSCVGEIINDINVDLDLCEFVICGNNSSCNSSTGSCVCTSGFNNCDTSLSNGCETQGSCNTSGNGDTVTDCFSDSDCNPWETCIDNECIDPSQGGTENDCLISADCDDSKYCLNGFCAQRICSANYIVLNHDCVCPNDLCGDSCYTEEGICCKSKWNSGINSCGYSVLDAEEKANRSGNSEAISLVDTAKNSIESGEVLKGKTESMLGELRAGIVLSGRGDLETEYLEARAALEEARYEYAQELILKTQDQIGEAPDFTFLLVGLFVIIVLVGAAYFYYINRNKEESTEEDA